VIDIAPIQHKDKGEYIEKHVEVINIKTPPSNNTFKRLNRQLRATRKEFARLKEKRLYERINMKEHMDMYSNTLDIEIFAARRAMPLHKKLRNLYRKKRGF
jgi:hypothetical protein